MKLLILRALKIAYILCVKNAFEMSVKCIVLDDDPVFCAVTAKFADEHPELQLLGQFHDPAEAKQFLFAQDVELILVDMEMPDLTGIDFVRSLQDPPEIIFVTAHRDYAVESYELDVIDYLIKPINQNRFNHAVERAIKLIETNRQAEADATVLTHDDHFFIRSDSQYVRINFADIYAIEALKDFVKIHTSTKTHVALINLKCIEATLPPQTFLRTHRSYIVNKSHITAIGADTIETTANSIPLGASYKDAVLNAILGNRLVKRS